MIGFVFTIILSIFISFLGWLDGLTFMQVLNVFGISFLIFGAVTVFSYWAASEI